MTDRICGPVDGFNKIKVSDMQENRYTLIADFAIQGRLAYLSHQETLACWTRALVRAGAPLAFSAGFNPRPRVSIPLPRSVGTQSCAERLCAVLSTNRPINSRNVRNQLSEQLPDGCTLLDVRCVEGKCSFYPQTVHYVFALFEPLHKDSQRRLEDCRADAQAGRRIEVQRYQPKKQIYQPFDISGFIERLHFSENEIEVSCRVCQEGTVRINELMQWLGLEAGQLKEPVKRTQIQWT